MKDHPRAASHAAPYPEHLRGVVDSYLAGLLPDAGAPTDGLADAMRYSLMAGGKRIRPVLVLATQRALGGDQERVLPLAGAIEMIHTYSLIHDDLPAMDDDDLRRGRPTLHRRNNEAVAILAGDALYAEAFSLLLSATPGDSSNLAAAASALAAATGLDGMVGGQYLDVEGIAPDGAGGLELLHGLKTGRLIRASCECVLVLEAKEGAVAEAIRRYAKELGLLFQIVDDILDVVGEDISLGKPAGSDERQGRRTFVSEHGLEGAREFADRCHAGAVSSIDEIGDDGAELRVIADYVRTRTS